MKTLPEIEDHASYDEHSPEDIVADQDSVGKPVEAAAKAQDTTTPANPHTRPQRNSNACGTSGEVEIYTYKSFKPFVPNSQNKEYLKEQLQSRPCFSRALQLELTADKAIATTVVATESSAEQYTLMNLIKYLEHIGCSAFIEVLADLQVLWSKLSEAYRSFRFWRTYSYYKRHRAYVPEGYAPCLGFDINHRQGPLSHELSFFSWLGVVSKEYFTEGSEFISWEVKKMVKSILK